MPDSERPAQHHPELTSDDQRLDQWKGNSVNNQHAGLSQVLAEQRISERHEQAAHARLSRGAHPARRHRRWAARGWWQLARWPGVATDQPVRSPRSAS
jgi:hypothetical protein